MWDKKIHLICSIVSFFLVFVPSFFIIPGFAFAGYFIRFMWAVGSILSIEQNLSNSLYFSKSGHSNGKEQRAVWRAALFIVAELHLLVRMIMTSEIWDPVTSVALNWSSFLFSSLVPSLLSVAPISFSTVRFEDNFILYFQSVGRSFFSSVVFAGKIIWPVIKPLVTMIKAPLLFCHSLLQPLFLTLKARNHYITGDNVVINGSLHALSVVKIFCLNQMSDFGAILAKHSPRLLLFFNLLIDFIGRIKTEILSIPSYNPSNFNNDDHRSPVDGQIRAQDFAAPAASTQTADGRSVVELDSQNTIFLKQGGFNL